MKLIGASIVETIDNFLHAGYMSAYPRPLEPYAYPAGSEYSNAVLTQELDMVEALRLREPAADAGDVLDASVAMVSGGGNPELLLGARAGERCDLYSLGRILHHLAGGPAPFEPDDPFAGLARRMLSIPLTGPVERRIRNLQRLAREYRVDGAINPCHWGCRQGTGTRGLVEDGLAKIGVPVLNLEVDCVDSRNFAEGQLRTRVEAFIEMIFSRPAAAS